MSRAAFSVTAPAWKVVNDEGGSVVLLWHSIPGQRDNRQLLPLFTSQVAAEWFMVANNKQRTRSIEMGTQPDIITFLRTGLESGCSHVAVFAKDSPADFSTFVLADAIAAASDHASPPG